MNSSSFSHGNRGWRVDPKSLESLGSSWRHGDVHCGLGTASRYAVIMYFAERGGEGGIDLFYLTGRRPKGILPSIMHEIEVRKVCVCVCVRAPVVCV